MGDNFARLGVQVTQDEVIRGLVAPTFLKVLVLTLGLSSCMCEDTIDRVDWSLDLIVFRNYRCEYLLTARLLLGG